MPLGQYLTRAVHVRWPMLSGQCVFFSPSLRRAVFFCTHIHKFTHLGRNKQEVPGTRPLRNVFLLIRLSRTESWAYMRQRTRDRGT